MTHTNRYKGTRHYIRVRWPTYAVVYGGGIVTAITVILFSAVLGWYSFVILSLAGLLVLSYLLVASLWAAHRLYDNKNIRDTILKLGNIGPEDTLVHIDLGTRQMAIDLSRRLTTGKVLVIDLYHPQLAPSRILARNTQFARQHISWPEKDPRLLRRDGDISLLPLPNGSVHAVALIEVASEFWQQGDRSCLFKEIYRILAPGGRLLMAERVRTPLNALVMAPGWSKLKNIVYWRKLLTESGFRPGTEASINDLICCFSAAKPFPGQTRQLEFDL